MFPNRGTGIDNIVYDRYTLTSKSRPERSWNSVARGKEAVCDRASEPLRVCELNTELKSDDESHKCALGKGTADRIYLLVRQRSG